MVRFTLFLLLRIYLFVISIFKFSFSIFFFSYLFPTLVLQVNGTFDMPQVRMCGVSTPYLRVQLVPGDQLAKETRSNFMNLSCNRLCVFDRLTLEEAKQSSLNFVVLDYDRFSRSDFVAEVMFPLADVDLEEGATLSRHLVSRTLEKVSCLLTFRALALHLSKRF